MVTKKFAFLFLFFIFVNTVFAQQSQPNPAQWIRSGPMLGYSEMTETVIWLQTTQSVRAQIRFWKSGQPNSARLSKVIETNSTSDLIARFTLSELEFGTKYDYEVYLDGLRTDFPYSTTFQTQPMWRWRTSPPNFRIAVGSCAYINDSLYDRPGKPYGRSLEIFTAIAQQKPDVMVWLGDNIYYREGDVGTESGMRYRNARDRSMKELQPLFASTHNYAIWDDHDYGPNDSDRTFSGRETSLKVFKDYWANHSYGAEGIPGVFGRFEWSDVEFFLLDDRYHRSPDDMPESPSKNMFGDAQMHWLMESLSSSKATFKVIAGGNQMMNPLSKFETFSQFPSEQKRLIDFIRTAKIPGVVFLSGDRHHAELIKRTEPGLYPLYDFTSSALTSSSFAGEEKNPNRVDGTWVPDVQNFGMLETSGDAKARTLILKTLDQTGKELWKYEIKASELSFPSEKTKTK